MSEEVCDRCKKEGHDRRTLYMACFYAMEELKVPFQQVTVGAGETAGRHFYTLRVCKDCRASWMGAIEHWFLSGREKPACSDVSESCVGESTHMALQWWLERNPCPNAIVEVCVSRSRPEPEEATIPIRERGAVRMITQTEWNQRYGAQPKAPKNEEEK